MMAHSKDTAAWVDAKWGPFTTSSADIVPKYRDALIEAVEIMRAMIHNGADCNDANDFLEGLDDNA